MQYEVIEKKIVGLFRDRTQFCNIIIRLDYYWHQVSLPCWACVNLLFFDDVSPI